MPYTLCRHEQIPWSKWWVLHLLCIRKKFLQETELTWEQNWTTDNDRKVSLTPARTMLELRSGRTRMRRPGRPRSKTATTSAWLWHTARTPHPSPQAHYDVTNRWIGTDACLTSTAAHSPYRPLGQVVRYRSPEQTVPRYEHGFCPHTHVGE